MLAQNGRSAVLAPGTLAVVDSARPYIMHFDGEFAQLVVRVPVSMLPRRTLRDTTSTALDGPARLVRDFLLGLENLDPAAASELMPHTLGLIDTALGWAAGRTTDSPPAITRERVRRFVRDNAGNLDLDADAVAAGCGISRRTLFRALADDEPLTSLLRRIRVERAQQLLLSNPRLPVAVVAQQCGFAGPAQLHRAFQRVTGGTPSDRSCSTLRCTDALAHLGPDIAGKNTTGDGNSRTVVVSRFGAPPPATAARVLAVAGSTTNRSCWSARLTWLVRVPTSPDPRP
jgi:AraC-like DNA-binding protein